MNFEVSEKVFAFTMLLYSQQLFIQMLEGLHHEEAEVLCTAKDKTLHQKYKGLSDNVVKEAFGWGENYCLSSGKIM